MEQRTKLINTTATGKKLSLIRTHAHFVITMWRMNLDALKRLWCNALQPIPGVELAVLPRPRTRGLFRETIQYSWFPTYLANQRSRGPANYARGKQFSFNFYGRFKTLIHLFNLFLHHFHIGNLKLHTVFTTGVSDIHRNLGQPFSVGRLEHANFVQTCHDLGHKTPRIRVAYSLRCSFGTSRRICESKFREFTPQWWHDKK